MGRVAPVTCRIGSSEIAVVDGDGFDDVTCRIGSSEKIRTMAAEQTAVTCRIGSSEIQAGQNRC